MTRLSNAEIVENVLHGLYTAAGRRTSKNFAGAVIHAITKALEQKYDFLKYVKFNFKGESDDIVNISHEMNSVDIIRVGQAVEALVKVICMDFKDRAGLYFINEVKKNTGNEAISDLKEAGIDFELLQIQQHYLYRQHERIKNKSKTDGIVSKKDKGLLDYSWENVSKWDYDANNHNCKIYDKDGNILDQLDLDDIVKKYINNLTEDNPVEASTDVKSEEKDKGLKIKKMSN
jgi:hypothetical protein